MNNPSRALAALLAIAVCSGFAQAAAVPAAIFQDHSVLQRGKTLPIWGTADPNEQVTVRFAGVKRQTTAGADGKWMVRLPSMQARSKPADLAINDVVLHDVVVGDVWLAGGQSNMEMGIGVCDVPDEIAQADLPGLRLFTVPRDIATEPRANLSGDSRWKRCSPKSLVEGGWGGFSAAGYFFGRTLHQALKVPIGIISINWGGTEAETWTSLEALRTLPTLHIPATRQNTAEDASRRNAWWAAHDSADTADPAFDDSQWKSAAMPNEFSNIGLGDFDGIVWFRRSFELPATWSGIDLDLSLGPIDDIDTTFINGVKVGEGFHRYLDRHYRIPAQLLKPGRNTIAVRVLDTGGFGGLYGLPKQLSIGPAGISLAGDWRYRAGPPLATLKPLPPGMPADPNGFALLYNGMVAPVTPLAIRGVIWYQGESNSSRAAQYRDLLSAMIQDWRTRFQQGAFPFLIVQLANFRSAKSQPAESTWAELREAQSQVAATVPNTGLAVAIDIGDPRNIHPKNKKEVGRRLALVALATTYGKKIEDSGPVYRSMTIEGAAIRLKFSHTAGGLVAKGGPLRQFAIAGQDQRFVWADARIEGDTVVVSSQDVPHPASVRYAWADNPEGCNLYNKADLPASPFRTAAR